MWRSQGSHCGSRGTLATSQGGLSSSAGLKISPMVSVPCVCLLCFIPESAVLGVFALKFFCGAGASKACLVQGIPLLSAGKLLGEIHRMGETQHCVCIFALQEHDIFMVFCAWQCRRCLKECSGIGRRDHLFLLQRTLEDKKGEGVAYLDEIREKP